MFGGLIGGAGMIAGGVKAMVDNFGFNWETLKGQYELQRSLGVEVEMLTPEDLVQLSCTTCSIVAIFRAVSYILNGARYFLFSAF